MRLIALSAMLAAGFSGCGGEGSGPAGSAAQQSASNDGMKRIAAAAPASGGGVMINEVVAGNWKGAVDEDGEAEDWVELYNPGTSTVDLTGYGLSNKTASRFFWTFPAGTKLAAKAYLTVWLSKKDRAVLGKQLHANFNLDSGGDTLFLSASNATVAGIPVDSAVPPLVKADQSWCRVPSGVATAPFSVCDQATPNAANTGTSYATILAKPSLSLPSGFYATAQTLSISGPAGAILRYTTDGSEPTDSSPVYGAPLQLTGAQVIRAAAFAPGTAPSWVETGTYVVSSAQAAKYAQLKAVMVAMSPADLEQFQANNQDVFFRASFELVVGGTTSMFRMDAEGKAGGNAGSADSPARVMNVTARDAFGPKAFPTTLLWPDKPGVKSAKKFRLRNGSNDWNEAHLRDQLSQRISADGPNVIASSTAAAVFINGRYYGLMDLREREDETLLANNLGVDKDYVDYVQETTDIPDVKNGGVVAQTSYFAMKNFITGNDMTVAANYARAKTLMNPESLAYDWALHMFHANYDWPYHNIDLWRSPEVDGRWTWRAHDMDWAFGIYDTPASYNMNSSFTQTGSEVIAALMRNAEFRNLYLNTVADQMNVMSPGYMRAALDGMAAELRPYIPDNHAALGIGSAADWEARLVYIRSWFDAREGFYDAHNRTQFGLAARQALRVSVNDLAMGSVRVNLVDTNKYVTAALPTWTGLYYPGVPIALEARPKPGYAFVGWQGASTATARLISQTLVASANQPMQLTAVFAAVGSPAAPVIAPVANQSWRTGDFARVQVSASQANGYAITFSAKGLPKGLNINPVTGVIYGRLTTPGLYASTVSAADGVSTTNLAVTWTVSDRPGTGLLGTSPDSGPPPPANVAPTVALTAPAGGAGFVQGAAITVSATAADSDGSVARVEFLDGATLIGTASAAPYSIAWSGAGVGPHSITARATDNLGARTTSAAVSITVTAPVNVAPTVSMLAPSNNATLVLGSLVTLTASAADADGSVARVEFYDGNVLLATRPAAPYTLTGLSLGLGAHVITALAVDNRGASTRSAAVNLTVVPPTGAEGSGTGLAGSYFSTRFLSGTPTLQRTEAVNFNWGQGAPAANLPSDNFSVRWQGRIEAPVSGTYYLQTNSDDGVRVRVNGTLVIDNWTPHGPTLNTSGPLIATGGQRYSIVVEYTEYTGGAVIQLMWKTPGSTSFTPVPVSRLYLAAP